MRIESECAFVLHARPWRESSLLVEVFCPSHGRMGLVARGVASAKRHALRAALQPLQCIRFAATGKGELATLQSAEVLDVPPRLAGESALAGFYLNELTLALVPRQDPLPELFAAFARTRQLLAGQGMALAWALRRYERDLLDAIGFGFDWQTQSDGAPIDPAARYFFDPEQGLRRLRLESAHGQRQKSATGRAVLALAADLCPGNEDLASLRRPMRGLLAHHLGPRGLKSWEMAAQLQRIAPAGTGK